MRALWSGTLESDRILARTEEVMIGRMDVEAFAFLGFGHGVLRGE
jgi:hypothetical protein